MLGAIEPSGAQSYPRRAIGPPNFAVSSWVAPPEQVPIKILIELHLYKFAGEFFDFSPSSALSEPVVRSVRGGGYDGETKKNEDMGGDTC